MLPPADCQLCPRLADYRDGNRHAQPQWHNAPVPFFGELSARVLIVGLAPGRTGGNRTGRIFTGDTAGRMLFETLQRTGFATGNYKDDGGDDIRLVDCLITNAVLCAPPGNAPTTAEQATCRPHLAALIKAMPRLTTVVTLGEVARSNTLKAVGLAASAMAGGHGTEARLGGYRILNSYHCSRLNLNTGRLTPAMFEDIFRRAAGPCGA